MARSAGPASLAGAELPDLSLAGWGPTRDALWTYARWLGAIRRSLTPKARHWGHVSLNVGVRGLTTGPMAAGPLRFELVLNLETGRLELASSGTDGWTAALDDLEGEEILAQVRRVLTAAGANPVLEVALPAQTEPGGYDLQAGRRYWQALSSVEVVLSRFAGSLRGEVLGPQLWPHHFDLAVLWLTGRLVPGQDVDNEDLADENMNFGFSTGDESHPDPYFYVTAYPAVDLLAATGLAPGAHQQTEGWQGVWLDYADLRAQANPMEDLGAFLRGTQADGDRALCLRASLDPHLRESDLSE